MGEPNSSVWAFVMRLSLPCMASFRHLGTCQVSRKDEPRSPEIARPVTFSAILRPVKL